MTAYVSRCPNCDTSFKVTAAQLDAADGAVRCGACLQVFVASDYFVEAPIPDLFASESTSDSTLYAPLDSTSDSPGSSEDAPLNEVNTQDLTDADLETVEVQGEVGQEAESDLDSRPAKGDEFSAPDDAAEPPSELSAELPAELSEELSAVELTEKLDGIANVAPDDLVGEFTPASNRRTGRWVAGCVVALVLLSTQYLWFERDRMAMDPRLRPYYLSACNIVDCQLPDYLDATNLMATDLVVRTHPVAENGLIVDAILRNGAPYRQKFPLLQLRFSDINGNTLAQRTFSPDIYLAGELAGLQYIPAVTEVRLSLDIVDPGPRAVSYSMRTVIN
jgi:predicted Zn finger-like uncharacterized protein